MFCSSCGTENADQARFCSGCGAGLTAEDGRGGTIASEANTGGPRYAGFWIRVLASLIDWILAQIAIIIIVVPLAFVLGASMADTSSAEEIEASGEALGTILGIFVQWLWFTIPESSKWQATIGKKLLGLKVTDEAGRRIGFGRANGRYWSKILSGLILCIGFIMVAFTDKKQGLHDKIASTLVVRADA